MASFLAFLVAVGKPDTSMVFNLLTFMYFLALWAGVGVESTCLGVSFLKRCWHSGFKQVGPGVAWFCLCFSSQVYFLVPLAVRTKGDKTIAGLLSPYFPTSPKALQMWSSWFSEQSQPSAQALHLFICCYSPFLLHASPIFPFTCRFPMTLRQEKDPQRDVEFARSL